MSSEIYSLVLTRNLRSRCVKNSYSVCIQPNSSAILPVRTSVR